MRASFRNASLVLLQGPVDRAHYGSEHIPFGSELRDVERGNLYIRVDNTKDEDGNDKGPGWERVYSPQEIHEGWVDADQVPPQYPDEEVYIFQVHNCYVNVYHITREYGGPEEGGWWYNQSTLRACIPTTWLEADTLKTMCEERFETLDDSSHELYSVLSGGKLHVQIEDEPGKTTPEFRPHYE